MSDKVRQAFRFVYEYALVILGSAVYAVGIEWFFRPADIVSGGVTGAAMIVNMLTGFPVGTLIIIINIPIFIIALRMFGFKFMLGSMAGMLASSLFIDLFAGISGTPFTTDPLLAAIFGGLITGLGMGIIFAADATSGGVDVIAAIIRRRRPYINFGVVVLILDVFVVAAYALVFRRYDISMYTVISVYVATKVIDLALYGISQSKLCFIISEHSDAIKTEIVHTLRRGVTLLSGEGAYSGREKQVLLCVVKRRQIVEIRKIIKNIDQSAFVIVSDTRDVFGEGFGSLVSDKKIGD